MQGTFYVNKSDKRKIQKSITQIDSPSELHLLDNCSLINPTFKIADFAKYMDANYIYVDTLRRYYFINDIEFSQGLSLLHCTVDVLYTWRNAILDQSALITRSQSSFNTYLVDDKLCAENRETVRVKEFPDGFDENVQSFILCCVGNTQ